MHATLIRLGRGNISTHHGQIKILKNGSLGGSSGTNDLLSYIRRSVKAGTYRTQDEIEEMNQQLQDNPMDLRRVRWNVTRGSKIQDYPVEYQILSLNPPAPFQPKMPLKTLRKQYNEYQKNHRPTDRLARQYLHKMQQQESSTAPTANGQGSQAPVSADEYYRRLLGGSGAAGGAGIAGRKLSQAQKALQQKSSAVQKSYLVAMKQYQLMQQHQGDDGQATMSEQDALAEVERLLATDEQKERAASRSRAETLHRQQSESEEGQEQQGAKKKTDESIMIERGQKAFPDADPRARITIEKKMGKSKKKSSSFYGSSDNNANVDDSDDSPLSMLYGNDQRGFEGYVVWTKRLQAVPYNQWTVGASTALDHWIAKRVLGLSEETWLALLEGNSPQLLGRGREYVAS